MSPANRLLCQRQSRTQSKYNNVIYSTGAMMEDFEELRKMLKADGLSQDEIDLVIEELTGHFDEGGWDE